MDTASPGSSEVPEGGPEGGRLLVAVVAVVLSSHLWFARHHLSHAIGALSRRTRAASRRASRPDSPIGARFQRSWQEAKVAQFKTVTTIATHAAGAVMVVFLIFTDILSEIVQGRLDELPILCVFACNYAALVLNYVTLDGITHRRMDIFYIVFLLMAITSVLFIETGPFFFILRGNDTLAQGMLALVVLDIRRSCVGGAIYATCCCMSYVANISAFKKSLLLERHTQLFMFWVWALWLFSCGVAYAAEHYFKARIRANVETEDVQEALLRVLSALCDSVVHLDADLRVQSPSAKLLHMLMPDATRDQSALQGKTLTTFMPSQEDRRRFVQLTSSTAGSRPLQCERPAAATHVQLRDCRGAVFRVELFHTHLHGAAPTHQHHLIGIRCATASDEYADHRDNQPDANNCPVVFERCFSDQSGKSEDSAPATVNNWAGASAGVPSEAGGVARGEVESTVGAVTECGRTQMAELWRCPRCRATRQDWGDNISIVSGGTVGNESVHYRAERPLPSPRTAPPSTAPGDMQTLFEWAPEVCRDVVPEMASTYRLVHGAAVSLEEEEHFQYMQDVQLQVVSLLLVGLKLEQRWPGLRPAWRDIVAFAAGAHPVPLRRLVHFASARRERHRARELVAWQLPRFPGSELSPTWWELRPEDMYNTLRSAVLTRVDMFARQAARRAIVATQAA